MDNIVRKAIAKWPNVPFCYRWLALDARGAWRMRDERAQSLGLAGDRITNPALLGFINRNYTHDEQGAWYFQNGPQRVYVDLEATPFIARSDPGQDFVLHTGEALHAIDRMWMTDQGRFIIEAQGRAAMLDDRDAGVCLERLRIAGKRPEDEEITRWLEDALHTAASFRYGDVDIPISRIGQNEMEKQFGFVRRPQAVNH